MRHGRLHTGLPNATLRDFAMRLVRAYGCLFGRRKFRHAGRHAGACDRSNPMQLPQPGMPWPIEARASAAPRRQGCKITSFRASNSFDSSDRSGLGTLVSIFSRANSANRSHVRTRGSAGTTFWENEAVWQNLNNYNSVAFNPSTPCRSARVRRSCALPADRAAPDCRRRSDHAAPSRRCARRADRSPSIR
jgi:hypothetical protein